MVAALRLPIEPREQPVRHGRILRCCDRVFEIAARSGEVACVARDQRAVHTRCRIVLRIRYCRFGQHARQRQRANRAQCAGHACSIRRRHFVPARKAGSEIEHIVVRDEQTQAVDDFERKRRWTIARADCRDRAIVRGAIVSSRKLDSRSRQFGFEIKWRPLAPQRRGRNGGIESPVCDVRLDAPAVAFCVQAEVPRL